MRSGWIRSTLIAGTAALAAASAGAGGCAPAVDDVVIVQPAPAPGVVPTAVPLTRGNIAAIVTSYNVSQVERARVAMRRAADPRVRAYADRVFRESTALGAALEESLRRFGVRPAPETVARQLDANAAVTVESLRRVHGLDVDRMYLESETANLRWLIGTVDALDVAAVGFERELAFVRQTAVDRLREAEALQASIMAHTPR